MGELGASCAYKNVAGTGADVYTGRNREKQIREPKQQRFLVFSMFGTMAGQLISGN